MLVPDSEINKTIYIPFIKLEKSIFVFLSFNSQAYIFWPNNEYISVMILVFSERVMVNISVTGFGNKLILRLLLMLALFNTFSW